jgi:hypothetical protein
MHVNPDRLTSSSPIIPVYRGLTVAGNVLDRDEYGQVYHTCVVDTTLPEPVEVVYMVK